MAKPVNIGAAAITSRLLESDLTFFNTLDTSDRERHLTIHCSSKDPRGCAEANAVLEIQWAAEIEARSWGIKDITFTVLSLALSGNKMEADDNGDWIEPGEGFEYAYPARAKAVKATVGNDIDAPTTANVQRLADPEWTVTWGVDSHRGSDESRGIRTTFWPEAEVDLDKRTIEITF